MVQRNENIVIGIINVACMGTLGCKNKHGVYSLIPHKWFKSSNIVDKKLSQVHLLHED